MEHCCVIGGSGFIGRYVVDKLLILNKEITVIGRKPAPSRKLTQEVRYLSGNIADRNFLFDALSDADEVINLSYSTVPKTSYENPVEDILANIPGTVILFETASMLPIKRIVTVSSGGVIYGKTTEIPISEDHSTNPISPYGISKLAIEKYAGMFYELKSLPVICVRPGNAYGIGQKPFAGQGFIATAIASIINQKEVVLFGDNGTIRDYIHVADVADGIIAALENGKTGTCYNIGTGIGKDNKEILDIIQTFAEPANFDIKIKKLLLRQYDIPVNVLNSDKLRNDTGWEPNIPLIDGIEATWNSFYHKLDYGNI